MSEFFDAFEISPLSVVGPDTVAPEPFRGIYAMPMFVTVRTHDLVASTDFWVRGLGFIELFSVPEQVVHLRRWAFQDVLLVPADVNAPAPEQPSMHVAFSAVLSQLDGLVERCDALLPGSASAPSDTSWSTREVTVTTPEGVQVVMTAARAIDPESPEGRALATSGIVAPSARAEGDNGAHD
ncbi:MULTISPECIES: VOC family protein [unclassified Microbacterium]|uniref:VOC family protein n=1 Tax=unclassified Microbacterium TaxID=2609290 RepID=UPI0012F9EFDF|nr:VOC family protein [Microbacterium sp. MAH-37]MVQ43882.1 VOC family protein [Microbacterium sp. MAH-37]